MTPRKLPQSRAKPKLATSSTVPDLKPSTTVSQSSASSTTRPSKMVKLKISAAALREFHAMSPPPNVNGTNNASSASNSANNASGTNTATPSKPPPKTKPKSSKTKATPAAAKTTVAASASASSAATETPKPKKKKIKTEPRDTPAISTPFPGTSTPSASTSTPLPAGLVPRPKIKIKTSAFNTPAFNSPAPEPSSVIRPKLKISSSAVSAAAATQSPAAAITPVRTPIAIKLKHSTKPPVIRKRRHEPGNGYDSEASDREEDPAIEENFILRMPPGPDCDFLRAAIDNKTLNTTSDVWLKFKEARKAVVNVRGNLYAAVLVDLPCVIEANKTLDKKNIFKVADICQMLLVTQRIKHEEEIWNVRFVHQEQMWQYPHGITPPMQYARKRRFRKRISNRTIEAVEQEVERLLRDDENAQDTRFTLIDADELDKPQEAEDGGDGEEGEGGYMLMNEDYEDEDAEGEVDAEYDYDNNNNNQQPGGGAAATEMDEDTLANDLESALFNDIGGDGGDDDLFGGDPGVKIKNEPQSDSESDDDFEEKEQVPELDDEQKERLQMKEKLKEEIMDLEEMIGTKVREYEKMGNEMLKARVGKVIAGFRSQLELKQQMLQQMGGE